MMNGVEELEIVNYKSNFDLYNIRDNLKEKKGILDILLVGNNDSVFI
jgi:hypothetical protein